MSATVANTSRHLQILKNARLVESRREGVRIFYRLADTDVLKCWMNLQSLAEKRSSEMRETVNLFFKERDSLEPITKDELIRRTNCNEVVVLDVRPADEYRTSHIAGAISIPLADLKNRLDEIPRNREIVAYCRGPYCVLSVEAIKYLRNAGFKATRLKDGLPEWREAGLPVE